MAPHRPVAVLCGSEARPRIGPYSADTHRSLMDPGPLNLFHIPTLRPITTVPRLHHNLSSFLRYLLLLLPHPTLLTSTQSFFLTTSLRKGNIAITAVIRLVLGNIGLGFPTRASTYSWSHDFLLFVVIWLLCWIYCSISNRRKR